MRDNLHTFPISPKPRSRTENVWDAVAMLSFVVYVLAVIGLVGIVIGLALFAWGWI